MSIRQIDKVFKHSQSKCTARLVLIALADVASDEGEVTAYARSQKVLATKANCTTEQVRQAIIRLVELGEVEVLHVSEGREANDYRLHLGPPSDRGGTPPILRGDSPHIEGGISPSLPSLPSGAASRPKAKRASPVPDGFQITDTHRAWATKNEISIDLRDQTQLFLNHHRAKGSMMKDWEAAWRSWMLKAKQFDRERNGTGKVREF